MSDNQLIARPAGGEMITGNAVAAMLDFSQQMGNVFWKAQVGGCQTENDGKVLALACIMRGVDPFEMTARNHIISGKLAKKADVMLADFNQIGGKHEWLKDGADGNEAALSLVSPDGRKLVSTFSIQDAKDQGLVKSGTRWTKGPKAIGTMLRARCTSEGLRMLCPAVVAGIYTPEELDDISEPESDKPKTGRKPKAAESSESPTTPSPGQKELIPPPADETIVDATFEPADQTKEAPPFNVPPRPQEPAPKAEEPKPAAPSTPAPTATDPKLTAVLMDIEETTRLMGATREQLIASMVSKNPAWTSLEVLSLTDAEKILATLKAALAAKK